MSTYKNLSHGYAYGEQIKEKRLPLHQPNQQNLIGDVRQAVFEVIKGEDIEEPLLQ